MQPFLRNTEVVSREGAAEKGGRMGAERPNGGRETIEKEKTGLLSKQLKLELRRVKPEGRKTDSGEIVQKGRKNKGHQNKGQQPRLDLVCKGHLNRSVITPRVTHRCKI